MLPRSSAPPLGPRTASPARRGMTRGGIQKRRTGPGRVDKDGDLVMDAVVGTESKGSGRGRPEGSRSRGRGSGRAAITGVASRGTSHQNIIRGLDSAQVNILESRISHGATTDRGRGATSGAIKNLRVHGLKESKAASNPDGGINGLLSFLERKAAGIEGDSRRTIRIKKSHMEGDDVIITASVADADSILKLNDFKFATATLKIELYQGGTAFPTKREEEEMSQEAKRTQDNIKSILSTRYDVNLKLLNLSALGQDPGLVQMGMFDAQNRISKLFPVLMVVCDRLFASAQEKQDAIVSVTLADNELDGVSTITSLAQTFPDLLNLDLSRNKFANLRALEAWRWRFRKLQNLKIIENPLELGAPDYQIELVKWFPALQVLNGVQVRTPEEAAAAAEASSSSTQNGASVPIGGPYFRDVNHIGEGFVKQFFPLYDNSRTTLANQFYDTQSLLSISINVSAPRSEQEVSSRATWADSLFRQSRNLLKMRGAHQQMSKLHRGIDSIKAFWANIPSTRHPDLESHSSDYIIECHSISGLSDPIGQSTLGVDGLLLMVHGNFEDLDPSKSQPLKRSFSRTFILGPGAPGGPPIRVVSDTMVLRAWGVLATPEPQLQLAILGTPMMETGAQQLTQEDVVRQLVLRTQMTPEFAAMCLEQMGWDLEKAFVAFNENRSKLPPNAFIAVTMTKGI